VSLQVHFEFPEPSELPSSSLLQLIDADFKYPGRDDFGLQAGHPAHVHLRAAS
jgi:hypothetical protein